MPQKSKFQRVCEATIKKHKATRKEHDLILKKIDLFIHEIRLALQRAKIDAYVMLGGSAAKGTFVKNDFDCDVFVRFMYDKYKDKDLSRELERALKKIPHINYERVHGSRDYFQGTWKRMDYEVIPVLYVTHPNMAQNITDMSPLHVEWLNQHITEKLRQEILLTKLFCKAQKVYGAESYMNGFSGHVVDLLTVYYGSFKKLLTVSKKWEEKQLINMGQHAIDPDKDMNPDKIQSPVILIDPVQPERNAAAALSYEQFYKFKNQAAAFLKRPQTSFFKRIDMTKEDIEKIKKQKKCDKHKQTFIAISAKPLHGKLDTIGTKIFTTFLSLQKFLKEQEFTILDAKWDWAEDQDTPALMYLIIKEQKLSKLKEHMGPPIKQKKNAAAFRKKHKETFFKGEKIYAMVKREHTTPKAAVRVFLKQKHIVKKARKWTVINIK